MDEEYTLKRTVDAAVESLVGRILANWELEELRENSKEALAVVTKVNKKFSDAAPTEREKVMASVNHGDSEEEETHG